MKKVITKEEMTLLKEVGEMFDQTGYVPSNGDVPANVEKGGAALLALSP